MDLVVSKSMNPVKYMINYLGNHPIFGFISGMCSFIIGFIPAILADDNTLKYIGAMGAMLGVVVAFLTALIKGIELLRLIKNKDKK